MKRTIKILRWALPLAFISTYFIQPVSAQQDLTIYPMQSIPQSNYDNPALIPDCKIHIGCLPIIPLPVMPLFYYSISNSGFTYNNLVHKISNDSLKLDAGKFIKKLAKKNYLSSNVNMELLSFGFKIKRVHYISLSLNERFKFRFCYPKDLISMMWYGNSQYIGKTIYFDGLGLDWTHYRELALGYAYQYSNKWTFGGKAKILFGMSNVWTKKSRATIGINEQYYDFIANSGMHINLAGSADLMNYLESTSEGKDFSKDVSITNYLFNFKNMGGAIDLGATYRINDQFSVGASLLDFGYIRWKDGARNYVSPDTMFVFEGLNINDWIRKDDTTSNKEVVNKLVDSVLKVYRLDTTQKAYWGPLNPTIYLSGFYYPTKKDKISLVARMEIYKSAVHPAFTLGYYHKFGKALSVALNYSYINRSWLNFGFGAALKVGPMQIFLTTDNIFSGIMPYAIKNVNIHFGCNLVFYEKSYYPLMGYRKNKYENCATF
jgi:hypothetical protein